MKNGAPSGRPPALDLEVEKKLQQSVLSAIQSGLVASAHDLSDGGFAVAIAESCMSGGIGASVTVSTELRTDHYLFSESQSRILLSASPEKADELVAHIASHGVKATVLGTVGGKDLNILVNDKAAIQAPVANLERVWKEAIPCLMK